MPYGVVSSLQRRVVVMRATAGCRAFLRDDGRFYFHPEWNPGRQVLVHACPDSTYRIDWQVASDYAADDEDVQRRVRAIVGDTDFDIVWQSVYRFHDRLAPRLRVGRVLLLGDLAHRVA